MKPVNRSACFTLAGTLACTTMLTLLAAPAGAQMVNDPSETIIFNAPQRVPAKDKRLQQEVQAKLDAGNQTDASKEADKPEKTENLPANIQPQLDLQTPVTDEAAAPPASEPLTARAVMVDINSNTLNYDKDHDVYVATGNVHMVISEQNSELYADKLTYDQNQDLVIAEGTVTIIKDGQKTHGSYAKIDLSRKSALIHDYAASVEKVRIKAKTAFVNAKYVQYENGRIIITPSLLKQAMGQKTADSKTTVKGRVAKDDFVHDEDLTKLGSQELEKTDLSDAQDDATGGVRGPNTDADGVKNSKFSLKMKNIDVYRDASGYDRIVGRNPGLYYKGHKILPLMGTEFSYDEPSGSMEYLGPDIGYDPDYGGFYGGPGWDFRVGDHGSVRVSPLASFGGGGRRSRGGTRYEDKGIGAGAGAIIHYRDPKTFIDAAYNSHVGEPVLLADRKLFDGKTHIRLSANEDYINGFTGYERPRAGVELYDSRKIAQFSKFRVDSFESLGYYKDDFFPTNSKDWFVKPKDDRGDLKPGLAGRAQIQAELRNTEPLLRVGRVLDFGVRANIALAAYTTGDFAGLLRGGPTMNVHLGNHYSTSVQYYLAAPLGDTPFVFDSYYRGRQNLVWNNQFRINNYLSFGLRSDMNLMRDNDKKALFTGNALSMTVGPKDFKVSLAYDVVRKRSYFGVNFFPGEDTRAVDFEKMRIFQPENYNNPVLPGN